LTKEELISQGHLIAFITGELDESTRNIVEVLIEQNKDVQLEYFELEKQLEYLCFHYSLPPESSTKQLIMESSEVMPYLPHLPSAPNFEWSRWAAASAVISLTSMLACLYFWNQLKESELQLSEIKDQNSWLVENYNQVSNDLESVETYLAVVANPAYQKIILKGTENAPEALAIIYWNPENQELFLSADNLANLTPEQQYQLWAIRDGVPVDMGVFNASTKSLVEMKGTGSAQAFAVTIEPKGGSENPTLSTMQVYAPV